MDLSKIYVATTTIQTMSHETPIIEFEESILGSMEKVQNLVTIALHDTDFDESKALEALYNHIEDEDAEELGMDSDEIEFTDLVDKAREGNLMAISAILTGHPTSYTDWVSVVSLETILSYQ